MPTLRSRERNVQVGRRPARLGLSRCRQGIKTGPASTVSVVRSRKPDHVTQPRSTNTARLICWRICRDQVPAAFSAPRGRAGARRVSEELTAEPQTVTLLGASPSTSHFAPWLNDTFVVERLAT